MKRSTRNGRGKRSALRNIANEESSSSSMPGRGGKNKSKSKSVLNKKKKEQGQGKMTNKRKQTAKRKSNAVGTVYRKIDFDDDGDTVSVEEVGDVNSEMMDQIEEQLPSQQSIVQRKTRQRSKQAIYKEIGSDDDDDNDEDDGSGGFHGRKEVAHMTKASKMKQSDDEDDEYEENSDGRMKESPKKKKFKVSTSSSTTDNDDYDLTSMDDSFEEPKRDWRTLSVIDYC